MRNFGLIAPRGQPTGSSQGVRDLAAAAAVGRLPATFFFAAVDLVAVVLVAVNLVSVDVVVADLPAVFLVAVFFAAFFFAAVFFVAVFFVAVFFVAMVVRDYGVMHWAAEQLGFVQACR